MCQNTTMVSGAWIKRYCVLYSKTYNALHSCHNFQLVRDKPLEASASVKRVYYVELVMGKDHGFRSIVSWPWQEEFCVIG